MLALFCDWRVMTEGDYKVGLNEVPVGLVLPPVILAGLRRLVGPRSAERLAVTGELISPAEALRVGLVDEVVALDKVVERAVTWDERVLALPAESMNLTRRDARADLRAIFEKDLGPELQWITERWWSSSTQATLRALVERLGKKVN